MPCTYAYFVCLSLFVRLPVCLSVCLYTCLFVCLYCLFFLYDFMLFLPLMLLINHYFRMTGYSPFQGETTQETFLNVSLADYNFEDEIFTNVSEHAKDFISKLLLKKAR